MIQFVELVSMDCWEKMTKTTKRMMAVDDEDTDGDIDNDLLTLSGPFSSSFQSAGGRAR